MQLNGLYTQQLGSYEFQFLREVVKEFYLLKIFVFLTRTYKQDVWDNWQSDNMIPGHAKCAYDPDIKSLF